MDIHLDLSGLFVIATPETPTTDDELASTLVDQGVEVDIRPHLGVCFPARSLPLLSSLPYDVRLFPSPLIRPLLDLALHPSDDGLPATLTTSDQGLALSWSSAGQDFSPVLATAAAAALIALEIPFVATSAAWDRLDSAVRLPQVIGRAEVNLDGFLEISTSRPQLVESSPLPGLFRLDPTHFGLPLSAASDLLAQPGFIMDLLPPAPTIRLPKSPIPLSPHAQEDLHELVTALLRYQARAICWESGLGRRIAALAAVEALDAWPATIITSPAHLFVWQRHLDLIDRTYSLTDDQSDVQLFTYYSLGASRTSPNTPTLIFDELTGPDAVSYYPRLRAFGALRDCVRIAIESDWPEDPSQAIPAMEILRPAEFRSDLSIIDRYPPDSTQRAVDHIESYLSRRSLASTNPIHTFRSSSTKVVELSPAQVDAIEDAALRATTLSPSTALSQLLELTTAGPSHALSPKLSAAASLTKELAAEGKSVAVITRSTRAASLLRSLLRPLQVTQCSPTSQLRPDPEAISVVRFDSTLPDLTMLDHVIVLDYPFSLAALESAIAPARDPGPDVTVIHARLSLDDALVEFASLRAANAAVADHLAPPTPLEIAELLTPRL